MEEIKEHSVFISYSWTTEEHKTWVCRLAERLVENGVDVKLDQWDLKPGHDKFAFMESMVQDKNIDKVLIICDEKYGKKTNVRDGGVGTETQIITPEIYNKVTQKKFIPIVREQGENFHSYIPTYLKNRIAIDMSSEEVFEEGYEQLLRLIHDKPQPEFNLGKNSFRIKKLILNDRMFHNSEFIFCDNIDDKNFLSTIIGDNGVGKTRLLRDITCIFLELSNNKNSGLSNYYLSYEINNQIFEIEKKNNKYIYTKNNIDISKDKLILPNKVLVCSFLISDNFIFGKNDKDNRYQYLGIRETNARTSTTTISKKIVERIVLGLNNKKFLQGLSIALDFIGLKQNFELSYKVKSIKTYFNGNMSVEEFKKLINLKLKSRKNSDPFWKKKWENLSESPIELNTLVDFCNSLSYFLNKNGCLDYQIDLLSKNNYDIKLSDTKLLNILIELDLIKSPIIKVTSENSYELSESSSGESHILYLITSILANLEDNSLILIDEPEISLHPSWIIKFIDMLTKILNLYKGCHTIITTHSHFILSDLNKDNSGIIILKKQDGKTIVEEYNQSTYGWSAENILYEVFGVPSTRNYYLVKEIEDILKEIALGNIHKVKDKVSKLKELIPRLKPNDPMIQLILNMNDKVNEYDDSEVL